PVHGAVLGAVDPRGTDDAVLGDAALLDGALAGPLRAESRLAAFWIGADTRRVHVPSHAGGGRRCDQPCRPVMLELLERVTLRRLLDGEPGKGERLDHHLGAVDGRRKG